MRLVRANRTPGLARRSPRVVHASKGGKRQNIGRVILTAIRSVQGADAAVADERNADEAARARRRQTREPRTEAGRTNGAPVLI